MASNYKVLENETEAGLEAAANALFADGYVPAGGIMVAMDHDGVIRYHQAFYKP